VLEVGGGEGVGGSSVGDRRSNERCLLPHWGRLWRGALPFPRKFYEQPIIPENGAFWCIFVGY